MDWFWRMQWELASLAWRNWSSVATRTGASNYTWWKEIKTSELQSFASWCFVTSAGHCESQGQDWKSAWENWEDWSDAYKTYKAAQWHSEACAGEFSQVAALCSYQSRHVKTDNCSLDMSVLQTQKWTYAIEYEYCLYNCTHLLHTVQFSRELG